MAGPTFDPEKSYILDCTVTALILKTVLTCDVDRINALNSCQAKGRDEDDSVVGKLADFSVSSVGMILPVRQDEDLQAASQENHTQSKSRFSARLES